MSSDIDNDVRDRQRRRSPHPQPRSNRTPPKPISAHLLDDDDDAYVTHALHALHAEHNTDDRKESEDSSQHDRKESEWRQRADWQAEPSRHHSHRPAPVRRHNSEKTSRSSNGRQHVFPFSDSSSSLSALLASSTASTSSAVSPRSPHSPSSAFSSPLDRAYTARFRHLSSSLLSLLSSLPSDPSLPVLLRSPLTASYLSDRLRELLVAAMEEERELAVKAAWEAKATEEHKRRQAQHECERTAKERVEDSARWEDEKSVLHRQLQQCEQALRAERDSNERWEAQRQVLDQQLKDEQQQRETTESDCLRLEDAVQQLQQKYKQQQQAHVQLQQQAEQTAAQLTQLQHAHTAITQHNTALNARLATQQAQQQAEAKELTAELNQRKLALLHKENEWRTREERLMADRRSEVDRLGKAVKEWKKRYSDVAVRVKAMAEERVDSEQRDKQEADIRVKEKAALEAEVERLKATLQEQKDRTDDRITRMKEMTVREWKDREAELLSAIQEEHGKAEELLRWMNHSSDQMAAMKQRLLSEREEKARADSDWQAERQRWEQTTKQREEQLKTAEQAIATQQQQIAGQSQQLAADIDKHHSQLSEANERANLAQQQQLALQADLKLKDAQVAQQREEGKEMLAHARTELEKRQKDKERVEARMRQLQPQLLNNARRLSQLTSTLPSLLATVRQLKKQQSQLSVVWRLECQSMAVGWDSVRGLIGRWDERRRDERVERERLDEEAVVCRRNAILLLNAVSSLFAIPLPLQQQLLSAVSSTGFFTSLQLLHAQLSSFVTAVREERDSLHREAKAREETERHKDEHRQAWLQQQHQQLHSELASEADARIASELADVARRLAEVERVCSQWLSAEDDNSVRQLWSERLSIMLTMMRGSGAGSAAAGASGSDGSMGVDGMSAVLDEMRRTWEVRVQQMQAGVL